MNFFLEFLCYKTIGLEKTFHGKKSDISVRPLILAQWYVKIAIVIFLTEANDAFDTDPKYMTYIHTPDLIQNQLGTLSDIKIVLQ